MPKYTVDYLYSEFSQLAGMRSDSKYSNDAGYWTGGRCNWGGSHNLREDCGTLGRGFEKLESLDDKKITDELTKTTSKSEFDTKKSILLQKINEITGGLQTRTGYSSSMFGVCIIWADQAMSPHVEDKMQECRRDLENLRSQITGTAYKWVEELKRIQFEIDQIEARMEENKRKASKETDPVKRAKLIQLIESDGKLLQQKYQEHQEHSNKFRFDPSKHVSDMIDRIKKAIEKSLNKPRGDGSDPDKPGRPNKPNEPDGNDPFGGDGYGSLPDGSGSNRTPRPRKPGQVENNQQLIIFAVVAAVFIFILMNQKEKPHRSQDYEEDYY